jgi:hypothetical protein
LSLFENRHRGNITYNEHLWWELRIHGGKHVDSDESEIGFSGECEGRRVGCIEKLYPR